MHLIPLAFKESCFPPAVTQVVVSCSAIARLAVYPRSTTLSLCLTLMFTLP